MVSPKDIAFCLVAIIASASAAPPNDLVLRQDSCTGSSLNFNGVNYCCPGSIMDNVCCIGASHNGITFGSGSSGCPDGAPGIPLSASDYSSLVAAATASTAEGSAAATAPASQGASPTSTASDSSSTSDSFVINGSTVQATTPTSTANDSSSTSDIVVINGSTVVGGSKPTSTAGATSTGGSPAITGSAQWALALGAGAFLLAN